MDLLAFMTTWFWYVIAFCVGGLLAWLVARQFIPAQTPREAIEEALAERDERPRRKAAERERDTADDADEAGWDDEDRQWNDDEPGRGGRGAGATEVRR